MALLVISLAETILIVRLVHKQDLQQPVPAWLRHLVLERIALLLCLGEQPTSHQCPAAPQASKTDDCSGERKRGRPYEGTLLAWRQGRGGGEGDVSGGRAQKLGTAWEVGAVLHVAHHTPSHWGPGAA